MTKKTSGARVPGKHRVVLCSAARRDARRAARARRSADVSPWIAPTRSPEPTRSEIVASPGPETLTQLASDVASIALGFAVVAKRASNATIAEGARTLEMVHGAIAGEVARVALSRGGSAPRTKASCGDRLRWEWLASSSRWLDGGRSETRLLDECERLAQMAMASAAAALPANMRHVVASLAAARTTLACLIRAGHRGSATEHQGTAVFAAV